MRVAGLVAAPPVVVALAFGPAPYGTPLVRTVVPGTGAAALSATAPPASSAAAAVPVSFDAREGRVGAPFALGAAEGIETKWVTVVILRCRDTVTKLYLMYECKCHNHCTLAPVNVSDAHPAVHFSRICLRIGVVCVAAREESVIPGINAWVDMNARNI